MKKKNMDLRMAQLRRYHQKNPWQLNEAGLYVPHCYAHKDPEGLSWWDDVGFIHAGKRYIVWWQHPRYVYSNELDARAWTEAGPGPQDDWLLEGSTKNYRKVGKSRKRVASYTCRRPSEQQEAHYAKLREIEARLQTEGIDFAVQSSWSMERLTWAMGIELIAPLEVRNETELAAVAQLARDLVQGKTTLAERFPGYAYAQADWVREQIKHRTLAAVAVAAD